MHLSFIFLMYLKFNCLSAIIPIHQLFLKLNINIGFLAYCFLLFFQAAS